MKVLSLDYGKKRIGVASGDTEFGIAFPRMVIENKGLPGLIEKIKDICDELGVSKIVVGLPLNMDMEEKDNEMVIEVRHFVKELRGVLTGVEVEFFDERLSSFEANKLLDDVKKHSGKLSLGRDAYAAQIILQRFFDKYST